MPRIALPPSFLAAPIAHRALHDRDAGRPENSRAAILAAVRQGYGIEIDVQMSSDGQAMVFHDDTLDRLTDASGPIAAQSAKNLSETKLRDAAEGIPTLAEILRLIGGRAPLLIEIKDQTKAMQVTDGRLEASVAACLSDYVGPVAVMSFNPHAVATLARLAPQIPRGLTTSAFAQDDWAPLSPEVCERLRGIPDYDATESCFLSHEAADLDRPRVADLRSQGAAILCWTIRSIDAERRARRHAQNITFEGYAAAIPA